VQLLAKALHRRTTRVLAGHSLKHWEDDVLSVLRRQGPPFEMPAMDIARAVMLTSGAMTTRIDGLEKRGFVKRKQNRIDGRSVLVRLTPKGLRTVDCTIGTRLDDANDALSSLTTIQRNRLASDLRSVLKSLERCK
jgi:DNA-binding MarR family transcriptional regulator